MGIISVLINAKLQIYFKIGDYLSSLRRFFKIKQFMVKYVDSCRIVKKK